MPTTGLCPWSKLPAIRSSRYPGAVMYTGRRTVPLPPGWAALCYTILVRDPVCQWGKRGLPEEEGQYCNQDSTEVDHIGAASDHRPELLRGICRPHHLKRTSGQGNAARAARRGLKRRPVERHPGYLPEEREPLSNRAPLGEDEGAYRLAPEEGTPVRGGYPGIGMVPRSGTPVRRG